MSKTVDFPVNHDWHKLTFAWNEITFYIKKVRIVDMCGLGVILVYMRVTYSLQQMHYMNCIGPMDLHTLISPEKSKIFCHV